MNTSERTELMVGCLAAALFMLIGAGIIWGAWWLHGERADFVGRAKPASGEVIGFDTLTTGMLEKDERSHRVPVVRFNTLEGERVTFTADSYAAWATWQRGDQVDVIYDPAAPERARIQAFYQLWAFQLLMAVIGIAFILGPPFTLWRHFRAG